MAWEERSFKHPRSLRDKSTSFFAPCGDNVASKLPGGLSSPYAEQSTFDNAPSPAASPPRSAGVSLDGLPMKLLAHKSLSPFLFSQMETSRQSPL